ncbi:hypothetical protein JYU34_021669 [Plutella xylostella]|uniref:Uncharacterized protein n=1 Tax=Plutella xylostella TaxID=51655 RepID=A0ABQ7PSN9_PLUXY|nr:hypothetical protein JYU34_021669 [Plutella xylostella]
MICKELEIPISPVEFEKQMKDMTTASANTVPTKEGANKILNHLKSHSIPAALATNSTGETVRMYAMAKPELFGHFHHMVSVDDAEVHHGKPHPDLFLVAASRFPAKADPKHVVMVHDKRLMNTSLQKFKATLILTTLMDFSPEIFGLPPYNT